jgi:hypothetical protein
MVVLAVVLAVQHQRLVELLHLDKVMLVVAPLVMVAAVGVAQAQQAVMHRSVLALAAMAPRLQFLAHLLLMLAVAGAVRLRAVLAGRAAVALAQVKL